MDKTPKLPRKSLSLNNRLRSRSSASPGSQNRSTAIPSSPISPEYGTPPHRKFIFHPPYSPSSEYDFSPRNRLSQSSINSPEVTWRWTQDDPSNDKVPPSSALAKSTPNITGEKELRKKKIIERNKELRRAELEQIKANKTKRDIARRQQCEQMELLISKKSSAVTPKKDVEKNKLKEPANCYESPRMLKERSLSTSSGYGSNTNIDHFDFLNDSEADGLLLEATQQVEIKIEKTKNNCTKELEQSFVENTDKDKRSVSEFLQDSLDDWFASLDSDLLAAQPKKPRTSLQRYKSMPMSAESPKATVISQKSKIKRYPSSSTLPKVSKFR